MQWSSLLTVKIKIYLIWVFLMLGFMHQTNAQTAQFELSLEIPKINASEYHAPYLATWIETADRQTKVATSLWYDDQEKWLKDIRQWWRKTGRTQSQPYDGVTGATRRPGMHRLVLNSQEISNSLVAGDYVMMVEAAREVGGREVLQLPFKWPVNETKTISAQGEKELGKIVLIIKQ